MKKVGKTTGPFKYDLNQITFFLNQITFDCTVEVRNRLKGLGLIDRECLIKYGQRFVALYRRQGARPSPRKKKCTKALNTYTIHIKIYILH